MKGQSFLKITSILMIVGGIIAVIAGVIAILGVSALVAIAGSAEGAGLLYTSSMSRRVRRSVRHFSRFARRPGTARRRQTPPRLR